jgi:hypothetical protein
MNERLKTLVKKASKVKMTSQQKDSQRISFAYGTAKIENENITREMVRSAARKMESAKH